MKDKFNSENGYFGGAVLADNTCGFVSLYTSAGDALVVKVSDDPEFMMSGFYEPCSSFDKY